MKKKLIPIYYPGRFLEWLESTGIRSKLLEGKKPTQKDMIAAWDAAINYHNYYENIGKQSNEKAREASLPR